ncbi:MAG: DUF3450 family protein [Fibrobacter sp.]|nr:DUF3450 family protein [Fibrobacter sp.]
MKSVIILLVLSVFAIADVDSDIRDLQLEKERLNSDIKKISDQIAVTDSLIRADDARYKTLIQRYQADKAHRAAEIDSMNAKINKVAVELQEERAKQARAKNRSANVKAKRKALRQVLSSVSRQLEEQVENTIPWERETRLDRVRSLTRDIDSENASEEEAFSRLKSLIAEETKFGDEVSIMTSSITRKNGELINAQILRIGNQWMVYGDEKGTLYGALVRKVVRDSAGLKVEFQWNEDLNLAERESIKMALDVKQAKKPPQMVTLPVSLSVGAINGKEIEK